MSKQVYHDHKVKKGLGRMLLFWFITLSIGPLLITAILSYFTDLKSIVIFILAVSIPVVLLVSLIVTCRISRPVRQLSNWVRHVANGDFSHKNITSATNEIGEMNENFNTIVEALEEITKVSNAIAIGDFSQFTQIRNEKKILGKTINQMVGRLREVVQEADRITSGDFSLKITPKSEKDQLASTLQKMTVSLKNNAWSKDGLAELNNQMRGKLSIPELSCNIIHFLTRWLNAQVGLLFVANEEGKLTLTGSYGLIDEKEFTNTYEPGEGIVGQAAMDKKIVKLTNIPEDFIKIRTGVGEIAPKNIIAVPFSYEGKITGVIEIVSLYQITGTHYEFLNNTLESIGIALNLAESRDKMEELLIKTQKQAEELQTQQEELRVINEELEEQTRTLQEQKVKIQQKNEELQKIRVEIEQKAKELELSSKYKSEFMANMSHELRTPLNSILILSQLLTNDKGESFSEKQKEFAKIIHDSGNELMVLINEILDLSKIEAGMMEIQLENVNLKDFTENVKRVFTPLAARKGLNLTVRISKKNLPVNIYTDPLRFRQVINNLLSNAFKFTEQGDVNFSIKRPRTSTNLSFSGLSPGRTIAIAVSDTGIGIPDNKLQTIFNAFHQQDGTTSRKYGGTGLGLSISRELAKLLGGEIQLWSEKGKGSTFTLYLPEKLGAADITRVQEIHHQKENGITITGDRRKRKEPRRLEKKDLHQFPTDQVPEIGGRTLMRVDRRRSLKERRQTQGTGVQKLFPLEEEVRDNRKDIKPGDKSLLIIAHDPVLARILIEPAQEKGFKYIIAENGETGLHFADFYKPSAIILDMDVSGITSSELLNRLKNNPETRYVPIHTISAGEENLKVETTLFLHHVEKMLPELKQRMLKSKLRMEEVMIGKKILIVDDDMRNVFALTSIMEEKGLNIIVGSNGKKGLKKLHQQSDVDLVLMDIMMPVMDGYEAMREIRKEKRFQKLPIIALTAKAMKGDRKKCIAAGANDYLAKPVDAEKLYSLLRVWLYK